MVVYIFEENENIPGRNQIYYLRNNRLIFPVLNFRPLQESIFYSYAPYLFWTPQACN